MWDLPGYSQLQGLYSSNLTFKVSWLQLARKCLKSVGDSPLKNKYMLEKYISRPCVPVGFWEDMAATRTEGSPHLALEEAGLEGKHLDAEKMKTDSGSPGELLAKVEVDSITHTAQPEFCLAMFLPYSLRPQSAPAQHY